MQHFTPLYQEAVRPHRQRVGRVWSVDETYVRVGKHWQYAYRALDEHGQVIDVYGSKGTRLYRCRRCCCGRGRN